MGRMFWAASAIITAYIGYSLIDKFDPESVKGKRVLVTGASSGIGEQLAYHYARLGARMVITARREERLKMVIDKCRQLGDADGQYHYVVADMSNMSDTKLVIDEVTGQLGGLDVLVLNHVKLVPPVYWAGRLDDFSNLTEAFNVNFHSYIYLASHARVHLEQSNGSIVVLSSTAGKMPHPTVPGYSAAKYALEGFFGALRQEFVLRNVDVSVTLCVIGLTRTEGVYRNLREGGLPEDVLDALPFVKASDTAYAILKGAALRERQIYYPYWSSMILTQWREIFPYPAEWMINYAVKLGDY